MLKQDQSFIPQLRQSYRLLLAFSLPVAVAAWWFREPIMQLLYHDADSYWSSIFGWLLLSFPAVATMYVYGSLLTAAGRIKELNWLAISGVLLNITLNWLLIPEWAAWGATVATVITQVLVAAGHIVLALQLFRLKADTSLLSRATITGLVLVLLGGAATLLPVHDWGQMVAWGLASLATLWLGGMIRRTDLSDLRSSSQ